MTERTDYTAAAEGIDYAKLEKKLDQLREGKPPRARKRASDVLEPVREKLLELRAKGWTYAQLTAELNGAGVPVKVGTLRAYLRGAAHGANRRPAKRSRKASAAPVGC